MYGWQLYDTTGTTEDWSYSATGGYGYTFEIGCVDLNRTTNECITGHFHPPFAEMVKEWEGTTAHRRRGRPRRPRQPRGLLQGDGERRRHAPPLGARRVGARPALLLRLKKTFETPTSQDEAPSDGNPDTFTDKLDTTYEVPGDGKLGWHINPSTRPLVAQDKGRVPDRRGEPAAVVPGQRAAGAGLPELPRGRADPGLLPRSRDRRSERAGHRQRLRDRPRGVGDPRRATTTSRSTATRTATGSSTRASRWRAAPARAPPTSSRSRSARTRRGATSCAWSTTPRPSPTTSLVTFTKPTFTAGPARELVALLRDVRRGRARPARGVRRPRRRGERVAVGLRGGARAGVRDRRGLRRSHRPRARPAARPGAPGRAPRRAPARLQDRAQADPQGHRPLLPERRARRAGRLLDQALPEQARPHRRGATRGTRRCSRSPRAAASGSAGCAWVPPSAWCAGGPERGRSRSARTAGTSSGRRPRGWSSRSEGGKVREIGVVNKRFTSSRAKTRAQALALSWQVFAALEARA